MPTAAAVPPPHGTIGTPASAAALDRGRTSSSEPGKTAASGVRPSTTYGERSTPVEDVGGAGDGRGACRADASRGRHSR